MLGLDAPAGRGALPALYCLVSNASVQPEGAPNAGEAKLIQEVVCNAIVDCEFCGAAAALGVCGVQCL